METRVLKLSSVKAGGSAGTNTLKYRLGLPSQWVKAMGLDGAEQDLLVGFDGTQITIRKNLTSQIDQFLGQAVAQNHKVWEYHYYNGKSLCSRIVADFTACAIRVENKPDALLIHTAFGATESPAWSDFIDFLEERCVPRKREGIADYLATLGLKKYDPVEITSAIQGRMAEDQQWLEVVERW